MVKTSQITIFMLLGLIILGSLIAVVTIKSTITHQAQSSQIENMNHLGELRSSITSYVLLSVKNTMDSGVTTTGFAGLNNYLETNLKENLDFRSFSNIDSVDVNQLISDINFSEDQTVANVYINLPVEISFGEDFLNFSDFFLSYDLLIEQAADTDANGMLINDFSIYSTDTDAHLTVPENSAAVQASGAPIEDISVTISDISEIDPGQFQVFNVYDFGPDGAQFFPAAQISLHYDESMLPSGADETNIKVMQVESDGTLVPLDSFVDTENNIVSAFVYHFSSFASGIENTDNNINNMMVCLFIAEGYWDYENRECILG